MGSQITSGGGFSTLNAMPVWQKSAVAGYFSAVSNTPQAPVPGYGSGRAYPDISAAGSKYLGVIGGTIYVLSGTSASAPMVGGMISLVNAARISVGQPTLGWINPTLYTNANHFINDIILNFIQF